MMEELSRRDSPHALPVTARLSAGGWSLPGLWDLRVEEWMVLLLDAAEGGP